MLARFRCVMHVIIQEVVKVDVAVATSRRHAALSCVRRQAKTHTRTVY